jgi:predicted DNA-binding transcriptional regulator YafY
MTASPVSLTAEEVSAVRMALRWGCPHPEPDLIRSARLKLEAAELAATEERS